jgi:prolyl-tRNA synthetase
MVGAIVMVHGDDQGLKLPPKLAPFQAVVVPIYKTGQEKAAVMGAVEQVKAALGERVRLKVDDREGLTPGFKFNDWEMRGVPLRIEIGPKDVAKGQAMLARRDVPGQAGRSATPLAGLEAQVPALLDAIQANLLALGRQFLKDNSYTPRDYADFKDFIENRGGFAWAYWCGKGECETKIKEDTKATTRCIPFEQPGGTGPCIVCGDQSAEMAVFARAY